MQTGEQRTFSTKNIIILTLVYAAYLYSIANQLCPFVHQLDRLRNTASQPWIVFVDETRGEVIFENVLSEIYSVTSSSYSSSEHEKELYFPS